MAFFNDMKGKLTQVGQSTAQKTKDLTEKARLNADISGLERQVNNLYKEIGAEVYSAQAGGTEPDISDKISSVTDLKAQIEEKKAAIQAINDAAAAPAAAPAPESTEEAAEESAPAVFCPSCGAKIAPGSKFCSGCGSKIEA